MQEDILIQISNRIKQIRIEKKITIQALAIKAQVSKGLISQIENNRTVPFTRRSYEYYTLAEP